MPGWPRRLGRGAAIAGVAFGVGAAIGRLVPAERPEGARSPAAVGSVLVPRAPRTEVAILSPLREGATLEGFQVSSIDPVADARVLRVVLRKDAAVVRLDVALAADAGPAPPAVAGRYAVFYAVEKATPADGERLSLALASILRKNAGVPGPPSLAPFEAGPPP